MGQRIFSDSVNRLSMQAVELAKAFDSVKHQGVKGQLREAIITNLFRPFLPPDVQCVTGNIVSADGTQSPQVDAIIYSPSILPGFLLEKTGFIPIEACLYAIEIKSKLTMAEIRKSVKNAQAIGKMPMLPPRHISPFVSPESPPLGKPFPPVRVVFAFGSDLNGKPEDEIKRYRKADPLDGTLPAIQALCVAGRGYWSAGRTGLWSQIPGENQAMAFLAGLINTIPILMAHKGKPQFGDYLLDGEALSEPI